VKVDIGLDHWVCRSKHVCDDGALRRDRAGVGLQEIGSMLVNEGHENEQDTRCQKNGFRDYGRMRAHAINNPTGGLLCLDLHRGSCGVEEFIHRDSEMSVPKVANLLLIVANCQGLQQAGQRAIRIDRSSQVRTGMLVPGTQQRKISASISRKKVFFEATYADF
jgi:hypothetical protein